MWRLPDGADLRLCRLAMVGFALVHRGRLLCSTDGLPEGPAVAGEGEADGRQLQLAVQPGVLRAWLAWHEDQAALVEGAAVAHDAAVGADDDPVPAAAELVAGVEFGNVQEAVLAVQRWAWRRCPPGCWGRERVCCTHLCEASPAHPSACASCSWLRSARLEGSSQDGTELGAQLRNATLESGEWLAGHAAALKALRPRWQQLGALFVD